MSKNEKIQEIANQLAFIIANKIVEDLKHKVEKLPDEVINDLYDTRPFDNDNSDEIEVIDEKSEIHDNEVAEKFNNIVKDFNLN